MTSEIINHVCTSCRCRELAEHISIRYSNIIPRISSVAAYVVRSHTDVRVSKNIWPKLTPEQQRVLIIHEVCHIVDWWFQNEYHEPTEGHGPSWVRYMKCCGIENPQACIGVTCD